MKHKALSHGHFSPLTITTPQRGFTHVTRRPQVTRTRKRNSVWQRGDERDKSGDQGLCEENLSQCHYGISSQIRNTSNYYQIQWE